MKEVFFFFEIKLLYIIKLFVKLFKVFGLFVLIYVGIFLLDLVIFEIFLRMLGFGRDVLVFKMGF